MSAHAVTIPRANSPQGAPPRKFHIAKVAVLGAGTMGARISAHLANAGVPSYLLDITPQTLDPKSTAPKSSIAAAALEGLKKSKPAALFVNDLARFITVGNFDDDLAKIRDADWIIEAVAENIEIKRSLLKKVEEFRKPTAIVTTNTSGLPIAQIAEGLSEELRKHWFGTHFFNPPRYMRLVEIIPTQEADPDAIATISEFCDKRLGKVIVVAKDTPNFIANRIGTFSVLNVMRIMREMGLSTEEVDALTGSAVGWPKSATFRTIDMVGLDILGHVVQNMLRNVKDERSELRLPEFYTQMLERKWLGDKTRGGFYKKQKNEEGETRFSLVWNTLEYRPQQRVKFAELEAVKNVPTTGERLKALLNGDATSKVTRFYWEVLTELWTYAANRIPEIANTVVEIDQAMKSGFNWELGPFELWDAVGVEHTVARMKEHGNPVAMNVEKLLSSGKKSWYTEMPGVVSGRGYFDLRTEVYKPVNAAHGVWSAYQAKISNGVVAKNSGASLIDIGDGIGCIELHSKMNALGPDTISFVTKVLKPGSEYQSNFDGFVVTSDSQNFSVGANIMMLLMAIQEGEWDEIDQMIRGFQNATQAIKFSPRPVVIAPAGMTLGGGCEMSLHAAARQPHAELYMGLVEVGVGLLPGGGGCKEMTLRAIDVAQSVRPGQRGESVEMMEAIKKIFETIAMAKVSMSAEEARGYGFLGVSDAITMHRDRVLTDAKHKALDLARNGYGAPVARTDIPAPGESILATLKLGIHIMREGEYITEHEVKIATRVAEVICGGALPPGTPISEQYLLDLERDAFKSLCGEKKTQERIAFTLKTGKPLRN